MTAEKTSKLAYVKALVVTLLHAYPFFVVVQSYRKLDADSFVLCTFEAPCESFRIFGNKRIPSTNFSFVQVPLPTTSIERCESAEMRQTIYNSLSSSRALYVYVSSIIVYTMLLYVHDCLVLAAFPQEVSLWVGLMCTQCQNIAISAGFLSAMDAVEVFAAEDESCLYRLPTLQSLLSFVTPSLLLYSKMDRGRARVLATLFGDFLYHKSFDVPFQILRQSPGWNSGTLLLPLVAGTAVVSQPNPPLPGRVFYQKLLRYEPIMRIIWACTTLAVITASIPIFPRFFGLIRGMLLDARLQSSWIHGPVMLALFAPCMLGIADSGVRIKTAFESDLPIITKVTILSLAVCGLRATYLLVPELGLFGHTYLPAATTKTCFGEGTAGALMMAIFLGVRMGLNNMMFDTEDGTLLVLHRSGLHINMIANGEHADNTRSRKQLRGHWLSNPRQVVEFAEKRQYFAGVHFEAELKMATQLLQELPAYNQDEDYVEWQKRLYAHARERQHN